MYPTNSHRDGPRFHVLVCLDSDEPYRFRPKPPIGLIGGQTLIQQLYCSNATLHARSLMDVSENMDSYERYIERTHLSCRDRKVLGCALNRIGDGDFAGAVTQPWKIFKAVCQSWADSGGGKRQSMLAGRSTGAQHVRTLGTRNAPREWRAVDRFWSKIEFSGHGTPAGRTIERYP